MDEKCVIPDALKKQLRLSKVAQIGYVVDDMNRALTYWKDMCGIRPWILLDERPEPCIESGRNVHPLLRIALAYKGPTQIELIQVMEGETIHLESIGRSAQEVHHLGFMVYDMNKRLDAYQEMGIGVLQRGTIKDKGFTIDYAYLDTVDLAGIIIELIQWRLGSISVPINRWGHRVVSLVGSKSLLRGRVIQ